MRIFSLQEWKSLWNLNKPPKVHPSIRNPDHFYSVNANLSHGSLPAIPRYGIKSYESYPGYVVDEVDSLSASARGRASQQGSRRAGSSLPSSARRARRGPLNAKVAPISRDQGEETYLQLKDDQTCIGYNANGMVDTRRTSGEPRATSSPVHEASKEHGKNIRPFPAGEMKPPTTQPVTHVRDDASPDDTNAVIYSTVQKNPSGKPKQLQQVSLAQPSWHKSRSQRELSSSGDDWAENANRYKQTHVNNRSLAKEPLKNWDHNRSGYSTAEGKSTEENTSRHYNPAKRSYMESLYDLDGNQSRSMKFSEAQKKFQQLANASQDQPTSQHNPPRKTGFATRLNCSIEPCNVSIQTRFNSQQDVTEKVTVNELYKSAAALPLTSENHTSVDAQYDYPRRSFEVVTKSGTEIQQRDSLYRWANSSGLPENDFNSQTLSPQRCRAQSTKVLGNLSTGSSTGSSLALLREERQFAKAEPDGAPSIGNPKDSPDDGPITSTPRTSARKALRPLTNSQENLVSRHQGNERTDWQEADILIRRQPERGDFGFAIIGGRDQKVRSNDKGVYVAEIYTGGSAALDGRLKVGDLILSANGIDFASIIHDEVKRLMITARDSLQLKVRRFVGKVHIVQVTLVKNGEPMGFAVTGGVGNEVQEGDTSIYIKKVFDKGVAARFGGIEVGDQLHIVNGTRLIDVTHSFAIEALRNADDPVVLVLAKTARINPLIFANYRR